MLRTPRLLRELRADLERAADAERAPVMQRYMKSSLPYHGVPMPLVRSICKQRFRSLRFESQQEWQALVLEVWRAARFREERYAAILLTGVASARPFQTLAALPLYETLIVEGAWWDFVDDLATHRLGELLTLHPAGMKKAMRAFSRDANLWKRRSAILCQLGFKERTDEALLFACIAPSLSSREFFLQKAIGWALRQYARAKPEAVRRYVREHEGELSALSQREALKHLTRAR